MKQTLFLMMGLPGSGKTSFTQALEACTKIVRVSSIELRGYMFTDVESFLDPNNRPYVFGALEYACDVLLGAGVDVVQDSNNNKYEYRRSRAALAASRDILTVVIYLDTPIDTAKSREKTRPHPDRYFRMNEELYAETLATTDALRPEETRIVIDGTMPFDEQYKSFCEQLAAIDGAE